MASKNQNSCLVFIYSLTRNISRISFRYFNPQFFFVNLQQQQPNMVSFKKIQDQMGGKKKRKRSCIALINITPLLMHRSLALFIIFVAVFCKSTSKIGITSADPALNEDIIIQKSNNPRLPNEGKGSLRGRFTGPGEAKSGGGCGSTVDEEDLKRWAGAKRSD